MFSSVRIKTEIEDDCLNFDGIPPEIQANAVVKIEKNDFKLAGDTSPKLDQNQDRFEIAATIKREKTNLKNDDMVKEPISNDNIKYPGLSDLAIFCASTFSNLNEMNEKLQLSNQKEMVFSEEMLSKHISNVRDTVNDVKPREKTLYKCSNCDFTADKKITVEIHINSHILYCSVCKHPCKSQELLTEHLKLHPCCDECSFIAISEVYLLGHKELEHPASSKLSQNFYTMVDSMKKSKMDKPSNKTIAIERNFDGTGAKSIFKKRKVEPKISLNASLKQPRLNFKGVEQNFVLDGNENLGSSTRFTGNSVTAANVSVAGNSRFVSTVLARKAGLAASSGLAGNKGQAANIGSGFIGNAGLVGNGGLANVNKLIVHSLPQISVSAAEKAILSRYRRIAVNPNQSLYALQTSNIDQPTNSTQPTNSNLASSTSLSTIPAPEANFNLITIPNLSTIPNLAAILNLGANSNLEVNSDLATKPDLAEIPNIATNLSMSTSLCLSALNLATEPKLKENSNVPTNVSVSSNSNLAPNASVHSNSKQVPNVSELSNSKLAPNVSVSSNSKLAPSVSSSNLNLTPNVTVFPISNLARNAIHFRNCSQSTNLYLEFDEKSKRWKYFCKPCQYLTNSKKQYKKHMAFEIVKCQKCSTFFHSNDDLLNHNCPKKQTFSKVNTTPLNQSENSKEFRSFNATNHSSPSGLEVVPNAFIQSDKESYNHGVENPYAGNKDISIIPDIAEEESITSSSKNSSKDNGTYSKISANKKQNAITTGLDIGYEIKTEHSSPVSSCDEDEVTENIEYNSEESRYSNSAEENTMGLIFKCMMCEQDFQTENDLNSHNCGQFSASVYNNEDKPTSLNAVKPNEVKPTKRKNRKTAFEQKSCYEIDYDDDGLCDTEQVEKDCHKESSQRYALEQMSENPLDMESDEDIESCDSADTLDSDDSNNPTNIITFDDSDEDAEPFDCEVTAEPALIESDSS